MRDTLIDYAICMDCAEMIRQRLSQESLATMKRFFEERVPAERQLAVQAQSADEAIGSCLVTGKPMSECDEYQIFAMCVMDRVAADMPPYMISGEVMDELQPLLSKQTTDELNGFFNRHFTPDPTLMEPLGPRLILV